MTTHIGVCNVCELRLAEHVLASPYGAISFAYCDFCAKLGLEPVIEALVAAVDNVAPMALGPTRARWTVALAKAREMLAGYGRTDSEKPTAQP